MEVSGGGFRDPDYKVNGHRCELTVTGMGIDLMSGRLCGPVY